ncbi:MAG: hypothetical protein IIZ42_05095 [Eubacterium sp.]|nr:hypothetical protein [Eubacterium sp.]
MAKKNGKTVFVCQECGYESPRWMGQCICGAWNSFVEEKVYDETDDSRSRSGKGASRPSDGVKGRSKPQRLSSVTSGQSTRIDTGIGELNRVLGGGLVKGSLTAHITCEAKHHVPRQRNTSLKKARFRVLFSVYYRQKVRIRQ